MNSERRYRKVSPNEWLYLSSAEHFGPFAIQFLIAAKALPPLESLRAAVAKAAASNPGARLIRRGPWWIEGGGPPEVRYVAASEVFSLSHSAVHAALLSDDATPFEIICWEDTGILFRCAHALMDAGGLLFFAEETFRALRGEALLGSSTALSDREYVLSLKHPKARRTLKPGRPSPLGAPTRGQTGFVWERRTIPGKFTAAAARLASAVTRLESAEPDSASSLFMFPVDLRNFDPALRTTGNLSNPIFLDLAGTVDWNDTYARMLEAFAAHEERATSHLDAIAPWAPLSLLGRVNRWEHEREVRSGRYLFSALVSHIGSISLSSFSCAGFEPHAAFFMPFDAPGSALTLIAVQHDHGLEISASCPAATGHDGRLAQALDSICTHLQPKMQTPRPVAGPQVDLPMDATVCSLIIEQATATPARIALIDGERRLTYGDMLRLSRTGAQRLREMGVTPGDKVALLSTRSSETILAILATFLAGAAFVPLDPDWPVERMRFVLDDCQPRCVVTEGSLANLVTDHRIVILASLCEGNAGEAAPQTGITQGGLAYVLYTSGSTGRPKGVKVGHESLLNYVLWSNDAYLHDLDTPCVFPFFTSLALDLTLTSLFLPLTTGGAIHVFANADPLSAISAILADPAVNAVKLTPSHLWLFWGAGMASCGIRKLIVGGEALPVSLAKEICEQAGHLIDIYNEYGPTEATVGCVVHHFDAERDRDTFVPIGLPIANTEVLILDEQGKPVEDGAVGEIVLAGRCLALGYLGRPEEDIRFGPHPFDAAARAYRTGDSGVRCPNGRFDYRGRIDEQVKIRGHRVELGEVEAAMEQTGLCSTLAVLAETSSGGIHLAAYVVWRPGADEDQLRRALAAALPAYMMPARFVASKSLPLNVNGKIDKRALRELVPGQPQLELHHAAPARMPEDMESQLEKIVAELGGANFAAVPRDKSLLELGLDSLQMMLLLTLAAKQFLPVSSRHTILTGLAVFLREPTIVNLAAHLRQAA